MELKVVDLGLATKLDFEDDSKRIDCSIPTISHMKF